MAPISILAAGMVTGVGLNAPASCAAIRCGINLAEETRFIDDGGEWILGIQVPLAQPWRGRAKLLHMVVQAIQECLQAIPNIPTESIPLLLCVAELDRPGRVKALDETFLTEVQVELGRKFHSESILISKGNVGVIVALEQAQQMVAKQICSMCLIAAVDSLLLTETLKIYEEQDRLLTSKNSDGFIPGEAGTVILVGREGNVTCPTIQCLGVGFGQERATVNAEEPLRADGLVEAIRAACAKANMDLGETDFRITDLSGEQYGFKESALALTRILRTRKETYDIWHPADCIGEVGAAIGPAMLGVLLAANQKGYAPGQTALGHLGNADGSRSALILKADRMSVT